MMVRKLLILVAVSSGLALSGCNTLHGAADDIDSATDCVDGKNGNCD